MDILHIFSPHKSNLPPKTISLEKTLTVGPHNFFALRLSRDFIFKSLEHAGFHDVITTAQTREELELPDDFETDFVALSFITASKLS